MRRVIQLAGARAEFALTDAGWKESRPVVPRYTEQEILDYRAAGQRVAEAVAAVFDKSAAVPRGTQEPPSPTRKEIAQ